MSTNTQAILQKIRQIELFKGLDEKLLTQILEDSTHKSFAKGAYLFFQDEPASAFYICLEGRIKLSQLTPEGNQVTMHYSGPEEAFGIIAVLREINYPVTAEAVEDSKVLIWNDKAMKKWIHQAPIIGINSIRILSDFIQTFQDRIKELSTEKVERRVARTMLRLARQAGHEDLKGVRIQIQLSRQDIAELSGTTLFTVSRILRKWELEGHLDSSEPEILIRNPDQLARIADDSVA